MFMFSFVYVIACELFEWKRICAGILLCIVVRVRSSYQEVGL